MPLRSCVPAVTFGSAATVAVIDGYNATTLTVTVPALAPGSQPITVTNLDGSATTAFTVPPPVITIDSFSAKVKKRKFTVQLSCTIDPCAGTITLSKSERKKVKHGRHKVWKTETVTIAHNVYQLTAGAQSTPTTGLSKSADKALKTASKKHPLTLTVTVTVTVTGSTTETLTVK
jgi:hypothetical protein